MVLMVKKLGAKKGNDGEDGELEFDNTPEGPTLPVDSADEPVAEEGDWPFGEDGGYVGAEEELLPVDEYGDPAVEIEEIEAGDELVPISKPWEESENWISQPIKPSSHFRKGTFRSKKMSGITGEGLKFTVTSAMKQAVYMTLAKYKPEHRPKNVGADSMVLQGFRWGKKAGWTVARAKAWLKRQQDLGRIKAVDEGEQPASKRLFAQILKTDDEEHLITGIALAANRVDLQTDFITPEEIRKTMIGFMERYQQFGLQHKEDTDEVKLVESYQAPVPFVLKSKAAQEGEEPECYEIQKGDWVITVHVLDDELWKAVKDGRYTGFSIEGVAHRRPVDINKLPEDVEVPEEVAV